MSTVPNINPALIKTYDLDSEHHADVSIMFPISIQDANAFIEELLKIGTLHALHEAYRMSLWLQNDAPGVIAKRKEMLSQSQTTEA